LPLFAKHPPRLPLKTSRVLVPLLAWVVASTVPVAVRAQEGDPAVIEKVTKMNKKAVEEYENLNFEEARKILKNALDVCSQNGLDKHPITARTRVHLGIVILAGFKQRDLAIKQFNVVVLREYALRDHLLELGYGKFVGRLLRGWCCPNSQFPIRFLSVAIGIAFIGTTMKASKDIACGTAIFIQVQVEIPPLIAF